MGNVAQFDALLALNGCDQPATCQFPIAVVNNYTDRDSHSIMDS